MLFVQQEVECVQTQEMGRTLDMCTLPQREGEEEK